MRGHGDFFRVAQVAYVPDVQRVEQIIEIGIGQACEFAGTVDFAKADRTPVTGAVATEIAKIERPFQR